MGAKTWCFYAHLGVLLFRALTKTLVIQSSISFFFFFIPQKSRFLLFVLRFLLFLFISVVGSSLCNSTSPSIPLLSNYASSHFLFLSFLFVSSFLNVFLPLSLIARVQSLSLAIFISFLSLFRCFYA